MNRFWDPTVERHINWLTTKPTRLPNGLCAAWINDNVPAYGYQESTGYLLSLLVYLFQKTGSSAYYQMSLETARALAASIQETNGCGRDQTIYLFDTSVCLRGLSAFVAAFKNIPDKESFLALVKKLSQTATQMIKNQTAVSPAVPLSENTRWSTAFNVHLIKAIHHCLFWLERNVAETQIQEIIDRRFSEGLFYLEDTHQRAYLHSNCYAVEGLLAMQDTKYRSLLEKSADKLARLQTEEGGMPKYWPEESCREAASDVTAQSVRIWQCVDPAGYKKNIRIGIDFLNRMAKLEGGIRYSSNSSHINSWTTIFTIQALIWQNEKAEATWLI